MTDEFLTQEDWKELYIEGEMGPHISAKGNQLVAAALEPIVQTILSSR